MCVVDFIANYFRKNPVGVKGESLCHSDFLDKLKIFADIGHVPNPAVMVFRNNLCVSGGLGMNVQECQKFFVFIDHFGGNFAFYYFAEHAFGIVHNIKYKE